MKNRHSTVRIVALALSLAVIAGSMGSCSSSGVNQGDLNLVSLEEEWQLGAQLERDLQGQLNLVNDQAALSYVNQLGRQLVAQTEMRNLPWEFHIVADPSVNAFNIPGGHVYINTGLIGAADNAAELAGVMAHEISHGVARHGTEQLTRAYGIQIVGGMLLGQNPAAYEQILAQIAAGGAMASFSRGAEREADGLGVRYMAGAGYDPEGLATMFEELFRQRQRQPGAVEQFFSTHPLTENRIKEVRQMAREIGASGLRMNDGGFANAKQRVARYN
jgi:predicted Zn-dependent protease